ncbi:MAG: SIS domain-containing protein [Thermoleophilaceae bacterium]
MPSTLEREIREQGDALRSRSDAGRFYAGKAAALLARSEVSYLVVAARGSSDNAALYLQYLLGRSGGLTVALAAPSLYADPESAPALPGAAVMGISQSGRSPDVVAVLAAARAQGRPTIALTNEPDSPMALAADVVVPLLVGEERSVAATKTYTASLQAIAQVAAELRPERFDDGWFERLPAIVDGAVQEELEGRERFDVLRESTFLTVLGRGLHYATARETALKLRELSGIPAEGLSPPDLLHGPVAALAPSVGLWLVGDEPAPELFGELRERAGLSVAVSRDDELLAQADVAVRLPAELPEWAAPMVGIVPAQAAALRLAELRGVTIDAPNGLKKVTLTR